MDSRWISVVLASALSLSFGLSLIALTGCGRSQGSPSSSASTLGVQLVSSEKPRAAASAPDVDLHQLVADNTAFATDLFRFLAGSNGPSAHQNLVVSPHSISAALAMTYAGARGETAAEMAKTLHFTLPDNRLHGAFNALDSTLSNRNQASAPGVPVGVPGRDVPLEWRAVNQLWGQQGYAFLPEFLDRLAGDYGAGMRLVDFAGAPEGSRSAVNDWVAEQTKQRIKDLLPEGSIDDITRLVLTNALYLYAPWQTPFVEEATTSGDFHRMDRTLAEASFMRQTEAFAYAAGDGWQAVELPYRGGDLALLAIVPDQGRFPDIAESIDAERIQQVTGSLQIRSVDLSFPKFKIDTDVGLGDALEALGMKQAFVPVVADFSGMDGTRDLFVGGAYHKGYIAVDEKGTEAAAATAVVMRAAAAPVEQPLELRVDRPFIWLIRDIPTGAVLFLGQVVDPAI